METGRKRKGQRERKRERKMWVHNEEQREMQENGSEERTTMWKRRKNRVMRRDGERYQREKQERDGEGGHNGSLEDSVAGAENQIINQIKLQSCLVSGQRIVHLNSALCCGSR